MYDLWNEMGMSEIEEQHLACQVRYIFKNERITEIKKFNRFNSCKQRLRRMIMSC